jgi:hypothetical protein
VSAGGSAGRDASGSTGGRVSVADAGAGGTSTIDAGTADASNGNGGPSDAAPVCTATPRVVADECLEIPALAAEPVLDGELDCGLALYTLTPQAWTGPVPDSGLVLDTTAEYSVAWRPDGLYFFVSVTDPSLIVADPTEDVWRGDSVELYVDSDGAYGAPPAYDDPGSRQLVVGAPATLPVRTGVWVTQGYKSEWTNAKLVARQRPGGYVVEAFVTAADLGLTTWSVTQGSHVGFDLGINVSFPDPVTTGSSGHRLGQYFLKGTLAGGVMPFFNVNAFCNPVTGG